MSRSKRNGKLFPMFHVRARTYTHKESRDSKGLKRHLWSLKRAAAKTLSTLHPPKVFC